MEIIINQTILQERRGTGGVKIHQILFVPKVIMDYIQKSGTFTGTVLKEHSNFFKEHFCKTRGVF